MSEQTDQEFDQLVANCEAGSQGNYAKAEEFNTWWPPNGKYIVGIKSTRLSSYTSKVDAGTYGIQHIVHEIKKVEECAEDPAELIGKEFEFVCFAGPTEKKNASPSLFLTKRLAQMLSGSETPPDFWRDATKIIRASGTGAILTAECSTSVAKTPGAAGFQNLKYIELHPQG